MAWCKTDLSDFFGWIFFLYKSAWIFVCAFELDSKTLSCNFFGWFVLCFWEKRSWQNMCTMNATKQNEHFRQNTYKQDNVLLLNWKAHAKIQALFKEKKISPEKVTKVSLAASHSIFFCHFDQTCHIMGELYQLQASSPVTSRVHQTHSAVTGVTGYGPYWQPWFFSISKWVLRQNLSYENEFDMHENQDSAGWAHFGSIFMNSLCSHEDSFWHRQKATWKWPIKIIWKLHVWLAVK